MSKTVKNLMIQGTMSGAGKSILTAGLLRVFKQDGWRCAPFKSQNMALNSFVTKEGLEMGRAQVLQAQAAGMEPLVCMNPVLLKPTSDEGSQVIVNGKPVGNMSAREYFSYKKQLIPKILAAYRELEERADIIVLEGAGSPAEINLKQEDIVNMGLAELVDAPVLLAGDIDRGGVFAQLIGTVLLLEPKERERIKGLIINKFRGDQTLLEPGIVMLEEKCKIPVTGVIPYLRLDLEEEDSLAERLEGKEPEREKRQGLDLLVLRVPHISNFTDFDQLGREPGVTLRYVDRLSKWGLPDAVILPGSKNTMEDLLWLRRSGLEERLRTFASAGGPVFGICGGYQMLGQRIEDPQRAETGGCVEGIGLLPVRTVFSTEKVCRQVSGRVKETAGKSAGNRQKLGEGMEGSLWSGLSGADFTGYEIHMGRTERSAEENYLTTVNGGKDGCICKNVAGTYVHGIFDEGSFRQQFLQLLYERKGAGLGGKPVGLTAGLSGYREEQLDLLAAAVRKHMDMEAVYRMMGF